MSEIAWNGRIPDDHPFAGIAWAQRMDVHRWRSLADWWPLIDRKLQIRVAGYQRLKYMRDRNWSPDRHLLGVIGELGYALVAGYDPEAIQAYTTGGDSGSDFDGVDVKCAVGHAWLLYPRRRAARTTTDVFAACQWDRERGQVRFMGWCFKRELVGSEPPESFQAHAPCWGVPELRLRKDLPYHAPARRQREAAAHA